MKSALFLKILKNHNKNQEIAKKQLESSFNIEKSIGFMKWKKKMGY